MPNQQQQLSLTFHYHIRSYREHELTCSACFPTKSSNPSSLLTVLKPPLSLSVQAIVFCLCSNRSISNPSSLLAVLKPPLSLSVQAIVFCLCSHRSISNHSSLSTVMPSRAGLARASVKSGLQINALQVSPEHTLVVTACLATSYCDYFFFVVVLPFGA